MSNVTERIHWKPRWTIVKFNDKDNVVSPLTRAGLSAEEAIKRFPDRYAGTVTFEGNTLTEYGIWMLWNWMGGVNLAPNSLVPFDPIDCRLGVSDNNVAPGTPNIDHDLLTGGGSEMYENSLDLSFPQITPVFGSPHNRITFQSTFASGQAEWATDWISFGLDNDLDWDGIGDIVAVPTIISNYGWPNSDSAFVGLFNRAVQDQGSPKLNQTWILILTVTLS